MCQANCLHGMSTLLLEVCGGCSAAYNPSTKIATSNTESNHRKSHVVVFKLPNQAALCFPGSSSSQVLPAWAAQLKPCSVAQFKVSCCLQTRTFSLTVLQINVTQWQWLHFQKRKLKAAQFLFTVRNTLCRRRTQQWSKGRSSPLQLSKGDA